MCAEAVWWRCHRRIIADYLLAAGETVFHITGPGKITPAQLTASAQRSSGALTYPVSVTRRGPARVWFWRGAPDHVHTWNCCLCGTLGSMFFFFSNRVGLAGSIVASVLITLVLLYGCSR